METIILYVDDPGWALPGAVLGMGALLMLAGEMSD